MDQTDTRFGCKREHRAKPRCWQTTHEQGKEKMIYKAMAHMMRWQKQAIRTAMDTLVKELPKYWRNKT